MRNLQLYRQTQIIRGLIRQTQDASFDNMELQGHWGRYLCVLTAGFAENSLREIYKDYVSRTADPATSNYATSELEQLQNPKAARFISVAHAFKPEWSDALDSFLEDNKRKDAIDSIMNNRHQIAHGKNVGISVVRVQEYLDRIIEIVEFIEEQCR